MFFGPAQQASRFSFIPSWQSALVSLYFAIHIVRSFTLLTSNSLSQTTQVRSLYFSVFAIYSYNMSSHTRQIHSTRYKQFELTMNCVQLLFTSEFITFPRFQRSHGSSRFTGPRFVGENKTDIHLTNWRVNDELQPRRQRETTIAPGLIFITTESSALSAAQLLAPGGPPVDAWKYDVKWLATLEFTLLGPSVPNVLRVPMVRFYFY